jgi:hypothetical protein
LPGLAGSPMMGVMMTAWLLLLILFSFAAPLAAEAQQAAGKVYRLGILSPGGAPDDASIQTIPNLLPAALRAFGYVEGRNLVVDRRLNCSSTSRPRRPSASRSRRRCCSAPIR